MLVTGGAMGVEREKAGPPPPRTATPSQSDMGQSSRTPGSPQAPSPSSHRDGGPEPRGIIVVPEYPIDVDIWTDQYEYVEGESLQIFFQATRDAWVYIFNVDSRGRTHQIFPNYYDRDNFIEGGWRYRIPDRRYDFVVTGPSGREHLKIVAVPDRFNFWDRQYAPSRSRPYPEIPGGTEKFLEELRLKGSSDSGQSRGRNDGGDSSTRYWTPQTPADRAQTEVRIQRVEPVPRHRPQPPRYAVAWTSFYVLGRRPYPPHPVYPPINDGLLIINTVPEYATVLINDNYVGRTPLEISLPEGTYRVRVNKSGYSTWLKTVRIKEGRTTRYSFQLR